MDAQRILVVNADEFGFDREVNRGVVEAHRRGIVTSASVMVRRSGSREAAALAREEPGLGLGLHLDLCELEQVEGRWIPVESTVPLDDGDRVAEEILFQLAMFRQLFARDPSHLDSFQDVHRSEPARSLLSTVARRLRIPLRHFTPDVFCCTELAAGGEGALERMRRIIARLPAGCSELVCRPARDGEVDILCSPEARKLLEGEGVRPVTFHDLAGRRTVAPPGREPTLRERGRAAYDAGDHHQAAFWFRREAAAAGRRPWPWLWLSRAQAGSGDLAGAEASIERALELRAGWPPALLHLADLHLDAHRDGEAAESLARLVREADGEGRESRGRLAHDIAQRIHRLQDPGAAVRVASALAERWPEEDAASAVRAIALWRSGQREEAERLIAPVERRDVRAAAEFRLETDDPGGAWRLVRTAALARDDRDLVARVAHGLRRHRDLTGAWEAFERAMHLGADDPAIRHWRDVVLGEVHVLSGVWSPPVPRIGTYDPFPGRILHFVEKSLPHSVGGAALRTWYLTRAEQAAGLDPHVVTPVGFPWDQGDRETVSKSEVEGIPHHRMSPDDRGEVPARLDRRLELNVRELAALVRRLRPAVLHVGSDLRTALPALALERECGVPVVYDVGDLPGELWRTEGVDDDTQPLSRRWRLARELECMREADRVVVRGEAVREALADRGIAQDDIVVIPNAVDAERFHPAPPDRELARSLGLHPGEVVLGTVTSFGASEEPELLVEAVARLSHDHQPVRGLVVGDGPGRAKVERAARRFDVSDRISFTGAVPHDEVPAHYRLIDVFVQTRAPDSMGPAVPSVELYEAMAAGRAVVVAGVEALRETVLPGVTGFVARSGDAKDLVEVLAPLVRSQEHRAGMGRAARQWVSEERSWSAAAEACARMYRSLRMHRRGSSRAEWWKIHASAAFRPVSSRRKRPRIGPTTPSRRLPIERRPGGSGADRHQPEEDTS